LEKASRSIAGYSKPINILIISLTISNLTPELALVYSSHLISWFLIYWLKQSTEQKK
jgi:hypothetical protein